MWTRTVGRHCLKVTRLLNIDNIYPHLLLTHNNIIAVLVCVHGLLVPHLHEAIHHGHLDVVKLLVLEGADVDRTDEAGWTSVYLAAYYSHLEILKFLAVQVN